MKEKIKIEKPKSKDLEKIKEILVQWTNREETDKYIKRISNEIDGETQFEMHFWLARNKKEVVGIIGLSDLLPKILFLAKTKNPGEIKILYIDKNYRGKGAGKMLVGFIESEARKKGYSELMVRSAKKYKETAYGFYKKIGYQEIGVIDKEKESGPMKVFGKEICFKDILLNKRTFNFSKGDLPCLISGKRGVGASQFTVSMAVNLLKQGNKILFFTAFPMATENLLSQIKNNKSLNKNIIMLPSGDTQKFKKTITNLKNINKTIIFVKNIEEFDFSIIEEIINKKNIILSGDIDRCPFKEKIAEKKFKNKIFFSPPKINLGIRTPILDRYKGYFWSKRKKGVIVLK